MREKMNVTPVGEYPENGLYDIVWTIRQPVTNKVGEPVLDEDGKPLTCLVERKRNKLPQTWDRARQWVLPALRLMHNNERFSDVEDVSIVRIQNAPYFTSAMRRDIWLMTLVAEMDKRCQLRRDMEIAEIRANALLIRDDFDRAQEHIAQFVDLAVEIIVGKPTVEDKRAVAEAVDSVAMHMRPFTATAEVEAASMSVAAV